MLVSCGAAGESQAAPQDVQAGDHGWNRITEWGTPVQRPRSDAVISPKGLGSRQVDAVVASVPSVLA
jgi:hypothetical protein